jgi:hypothetical protein
MYENIGGVVGSPSSIKSKSLITFTIFPIHYLFQDVLGIYKFVNITPWEHFILFVTLAVIIYGFYNWQEKIFKRDFKETDKHNNLG